MDSKLILYVGQMIYRKGIDVLLDAVRSMPKTIAVYMIGQESDSTYADMAKSYGLDNVKFFNFMSKDRLKLYYQAADVFVLPTREDIWGLVINEALSYGLVVVSTKRCVAANEMLPDRCLVDVEDSETLAERIIESFNNDENAWELFSLKKTMEYSIDNSSTVHISVLRQQNKKVLGENVK